MENGPASLAGFHLKQSLVQDLLIADRYRVVGYLGQGGTAEVFLAEDQSLLDQGSCLGELSLRQLRGAPSPALVVIKRMKATVAESDELRMRFIAEARALRCVSHANVVRVLDLGEPEGCSPYLALEALRGESLGDFLRRDQVMSLPLAVRMMIEVGRALSAVHGANMVHRDIKPDNIFLVGPMGDPESFKVLDFGMARLSDESHNPDSTSILGTAQYMAPEQILVEPVDARTDVYALGMVLFRTVTGVLPFDVDAQSDLLRHQLFSPVPPAGWLDETLPPAIEQIIQRATRKAPSARFASMDEMVAALEKFLVQAELPSSVRPSASPPPPKSDVYCPTTERGRQAAEVLAAGFGIYARPQAQASLRGEAEAAGAPIETAVEAVAPPPGAEPPHGALTAS